MKKLSLALIILNLLNLLKTVPYDPQYYTFKIDDNFYIKIEEDFSISIIKYEHPCYDLVDNYEVEII